MELNAIHTNVYKADTSFCLIFYNSKMNIYSYDIC